MNQQTITKDYIKQFLPEDPVIVEAGAHKGRDTIKLAKHFPLSSIHAFEPLPELYSQLVERTAGYSSITTYNYALADETGSTHMYQSSGSSDAASSLLAPELYLSERPGISFTSGIPVKCVTLDDWARLHGIKKIDFMWLDMQGFEQAMLKASPEMLKKTGLIHTEINYSQRYTGHPLFTEYKLWFEDNGFELICEVAKKETWGNALFKKRA